MKTKVYVAAPLTELATARTLAGILREIGHTIVSTWHDGTPTVEMEEALSAVACGTLADKCVEEVLSSHALVLLYGPETTRHGSIFEAGVAYGAEIDVFVISIRPSSVLPTALLRGRFTHHCALADVVSALRGVP